VTRLFKPRMALVPLPCLWLLLATGPNTQPFYQKTVIISTDRPIRFAEAVIKALRGETGIVEPTFVYLPGIAGGDEIAKATGVEFFSTLVTLGVSNVHPETYRSSPANTMYRPMVPKRSLTCSTVSPIRRRSSLKLAPRASRATSKRASTSSRTPHQSKCPPLSIPALQSVIHFNAALLSPPDPICRCSFTHPDMERASLIIDITER